MGKNELILIKELVLSDLPKDAVIVILDGQKMQTKHEFLEEAGTAFSFSPPYSNNLDQFSDWIRDLNWEPFENCKKIILIIKNQRQLLCTNLQERQVILDIFIEDILQYWERDVVHCMVGGKCKEFHIYLVDEIK